MTRHRVSERFRTERLTTSTRERVCEPYGVPRGARLRVGSPTLGLTATAVWNFDAATTCYRSQSNGPPNPKTNDR